MMYGAAAACSCGIRNKKNGRRRKSMRPPRVAKDRQRGREKKKGERQAEMKEKSKGEK
jgi:hypothetical protein